MSKGRVIVLDKTMVKSRAWLSLSRTAVHIYLLLRCKCQIAKKSRWSAKRSDDFMGRLLNNGELVFTYAEAKRLYGITAGRFSRAIDELVERGFIEITATGMGVHKVESWYAISDRWRDYGTPSFKTVKRPEPTIRSSGFRKGNTLWQKANRKKSTAIRAHGAVFKNAHGEVLAMRTNAHGQKVVNRYNFCEGQWLCTQFA